MVLGRSERTREEEEEERKRKEMDGKEEYLSRRVCPKANCLLVCECETRRDQTR